MKYIKLKKLNNKWLGICPFHEEKTPSFTANMEDSSFYCFGCSKGGKLTELGSQYAVVFEPESQIRDFESQDGLVEIEALLPAWFIGRMYTDAWHFGLLMSNGVVIVIESILDVHECKNGKLWIDVALTGGDEDKSNPLTRNMCRAPTSRTTMSINVDYIMGAYELADT